MSRYGHADDGGWNLCASSLPPPAQPCVVYSLGINRDTSFDFDFVGRHPHCTIDADNLVINIAESQMPPLLPLPWVSGRASQC